MRISYIKIVQRNGKTTLNGRDLPVSFEEYDIKNGKVYNKDNTQRAYISKRKLVIEDLTEKIVSDDPKTKITKLGKISLGGTVESAVEEDPFACNNDIFKSESKKSKPPVNDGVYENVNYVLVENNDDSIVLKRSKDNKVYVKGAVSEEPYFFGKHLGLKDLEGVLTLPNNSKIGYMKIETTTGSISGELFNQGIIRTSTGDINLELYSSMMVSVKSESGNVNVKGMRSSHGMYVPNLVILPRGMLIINTTTGNINITYKKS
jgi:hypothetical protein